MEKIEIQKSLVIIKPDSVKRSLIGDIISRFEKRGYIICDMKKMTISEKLAGKHYEEHKDKWFFSVLVDFIVSGPVVVFTIEGANAVEAARSTIGSTDPKDALPGTIRGDYGNSIASNLVHASDSIDSAKREIELFFGK